MSNPFSGPPKASESDVVTTLDITAVAQDPYFIPETTDLFEQLQAFRARREHFALVIDEYGAFQDCHLRRYLGRNCRRY